MTNPVLILIFTKGLFFSFLTRILEKRMTLMVSPMASSSQVSLEAPHELFCFWVLSMRRLSVHKVPIRVTT